MFTILYILSGTRQRPAWRAIKHFGITQLVGSEENWDKTIAEGPPNSCHSSVQFSSMDVKWLR